MRLRSLSGFVALVLLSPALADAVRAQALPDIPPRERAANDRSEYRRFVLENGMKVILLSDPKLNKSSASVAVGVGSLSDPKERQGLAHFLEHMLFLGTEKYPDVSDYGNFLKSNGGYSNAYTAEDRTNFHFEIRHEAFEGALDRFSQFFIAPLFDPKFTGREMNAVNSENQKNLENDLWRENQLANLFAREGHPARHFGTGDRTTLGGTTREELLAFYNAHYSANVMTLALTGAASLDELEHWARTYFSPVKNRNLPEIHFDPDFFEQKPVIRLVRMEPIKDLRQLSLMFSLPGTRADWPDKSDALVGYIFGYEGAGSLLSKLKTEGLATGMSAGISDDCADYGSLNATISLTPLGLEEYQQVIELFFSAVAGMRKAGYPSYLFHERKTLAGLDEIYADKGEGAQRAVYLANQLRDYPIDVAEREPYLWLKEDPAHYNAIVDRLRPDNLLVILAAKGVKTNAAEPYYGTKYSYTEETGAPYETLVHAPAVADAPLPKPNQFIPTHVDVLAQEPLHLIDEPALSLYFAQDAEFLRPMVSQVYRFRLPRSAASLHTAVMLRFYDACVSEALNEVAYAAGEAGLHFGISADLEGVNIAIDGYDDSAPRLLDAVAANLTTLNISEERFANLKDRITRELANFPKNDAWKILVESRRAAIREFYYRPDEELAEAQKVTFAQVRAFASSLYARGKLEALVYGNVTAADAVAAARKLGAALKTKAIPPAEILKRRLLVMKPGESVFESEKLAVNNSAFRREYMLGDDSPEMRAATLVLANFIDEPFYAEMRTRQQLGYIVFGGAGDEEHTNFAYFIIQSGDHPADDVQGRADEFIARLPALLEAVPDEAWAQLIDGVRSQLEQKDKSISERAGRFFKLAYDYDGDWERRAETEAALDKLSKARLHEILATALDPKTSEMRTFLGFGRTHEAKTTEKPTFTDRAVWKKAQSFK